jgi:hypothetical protein
MRVQAIHVGVVVRYNPQTGAVVDVPGSNRPVPGAAAEE